MDDYRKTIQIKEGVITAGFPFNENVDKLKDNFNIAFCRLQALLRTLRDDKEKLRIYDDTFQTYIKEGIIEECVFNPTGVTAFYLPHRHVWTPGKSTELRVVFDASSHGRNELSLNDVIYEGHALTPLIHEVLLQFRTHKNTMVADIQKVFLQIRLPDHHRDATRFLWIKDLDSPAEGLLTPLIVPAKVFLQDIHKMKLGWETPLPDEASQQWSSTRSNIIGFSKSIPRKVLEKDPKAEHILSIFVDSSKRTYACSLYVTTTAEDGRVDTQLFTAKSKVAPLKKAQTIRRLELLSIFLGLSVAESTISKNEVKFARVNVFSDSTIALSWVHTSKKLPPAVTTLVQKIGFATERIQASSPVMFYHVPTDENVADCATRAVAKQEFARANWWTGPKRLNYPCETWPVTHINNLDRNTFEDVETLAVQSTEEEKTDAIWPVETISNYSKLRRIVAYSLRFIRHSSKNTRLHFLDNGIQTMTPNTAEVELAEKCIIKQEQNIHGTSAAIQNKHFNVGYDNEGILKRFGRIQHADVLKDVASSMYIPRQSILGARIAEHIHRNMAHCGSNQLVCELRQRFWIPKDKALCKKTVRNCVTCKKFNSALFSYPDMGPLPKERFTQAPPFSHTGIDYMGPTKSLNLVEVNGQWRSYSSSSQAEMAKSGV
ncbi:Pao retrotransposon peptidase [Ancylostoma duodenale]|uniref:Pao retrotransposon peptidase n=1 Tax=Ancylostoma duodenale TaxID=51022 RepID=A0A0C2DSN9_9BILA|nr:Pao retrotransposon peptidase [Ancylostoma duodenale]